MHTFSHHLSQLNRQALFIVIGLSCVSVHALDTKRDNIQTFINTMVVDYHFDRGQVTSVLAQAETKESILKAISRPAEKSKPWHEYRTLFVNDKRINGGVKFWREHKQAIERAAKETGVPPEIIVAIIGVETYYGGNTGSYRVIDALSTLAFDYPPRSEFFTKELENFFLLAKEDGVDLLTAKGSYAGAMGAPQFMPSSYRVYSADGDGDGKRDLFSSWEDIFTSIANYFIGHGWQPNEPVVSRIDLDVQTAEKLALEKILPVYRVGFLRGQGLNFEQVTGDEALAMIVNLDGKESLETWIGYQNFYTITRYNRSKMYAMSVHQLGDAIREKLHRAE